jgi:tetratricopeptide (TPR) repeat protein
MWMRKADEHRRRGLHENSLRYYSRALEVDRSLAAGWLGQVQMLVLLGECPEAELWARKSLEIFKGHGDLMAARAQALGRIGDATVAVELVDAALRQEGCSAYRWMVRGELLLRTRDEVDRHCFDKAVQTDGDWLVALEIALICLHHQQPSKAQLRARQAVEKAPQSAYAHFVQGQCEQAMGLDRQARESYRRCLELHPRHVEAGRKLAEISNQSWSLSKGLRRLISRA